MLISTDCTLTRRITCMKMIPILNLLQQIYNEANSLVILLISAYSIDYPNYQQRRIYYNQTDNVCVFHEQSYRTLLIINFSDRPQIRKLIPGQTGCDNTAHKHLDHLEPGNIMCLTQHSSQIYGYACFNQTTTVRRIMNFLLSVDQNVTVINPVSFDKIFYTCIIEGDGTIQHFGPVNAFRPQVQAPSLNMFALEHIPLNKNHRQSFICEITYSLIKEKAERLREQRISSLLFISRQSIIVSMDSTLFCSRLEPQIIQSVFKRTFFLNSKSC